MKMTIYLGGKKITRTAMAAKIGAARLDRLIEEAREGFMEDPETEQSWYLGGYGIMVIEFR